MKIKDGFVVPDKAELIHLKPDDCLIEAINKLCEAQLMLAKVLLSIGQPEICFKDDPDA